MKNLQTLTAALAAVLTACTIIFLVRLAGLEIAGSTVPFDTDEADHANPALELFLAGKEVNPAGIYNAVINQAFYPPLNSFFVAASYAAFGPSWFSSRLPSLICYVIYLLLLGAAIYSFTRDKKSSAAPAVTLGVLLAATSPITVYNSALCMLELPGMLFIALCLFIFARSNTNWFLAACAALAVFFTKYNFGIMTLPACILTFALTPSKESISFRFKRAALAGVACGAVIILWALLTDRAAFFHFFVGHRDYAPLLSAENLFYEPNAWLKSYTVDPVLGGVVMALALFGAAFYRSRPAVLFSVFNTAFSLFVLTLSATNEERHFMVALPTIIFLAAAGFHALLAKLTPMSRAFVPLASSLAIILLTIVKLPEMKAHLAGQYEGEGTFHELFEFIYKNVDPAEPVLLYGISDDFSIEALRWFAAKEGPRSYRTVKFDAYPFRDDKNFTAKKRKRNLDRPYSAPGFPKKPLDKVLAQNYYLYGVHILNLSKKQRFLKEGDEFKALLSDKEKARLTLGSREVVIYDLK